MIEQVEFKFKVKAEVPVMQNLVEALNNNNLVQIEVIANEMRIGPAFLWLDVESAFNQERWEYKVTSPLDDIESWLNNLGAEGWVVMKQPEEVDSWWYFMRRLS